MSKKKAIKIATASAIALTGAVAVAQPQAEAATNSVDKAITKATKQVDKAFNLYYNTAKKSNKLPSGSAIRKEVKLAEQYYAAAEAEIAKKGGSKAQKAAYTKKLEKSKTSLNRAKNYVAAISVTLKSSRTAFEAAVEEGKQSKVLSSKKALDAKIATFEAAVKKVFGPDARRVLTKVYTTPAKAEAASVDTELKVYAAYKEIESKKLITTDLKLAGEKIESVKAEVEELKAKDTKLAKNILKAVEKNNKAYEAAVEAAKVPAVESVSAINATQVVVKFNKEVNKTDAQLVAKYAIGANNPTSAVLGEDKKTVTLTFANASHVEVTNGTVVVEPVKTAADTDVTTTKYVSVLTYEDKEKPEIASVEAKTKGSVATSLTVKASEPIASGLAKVNGEYVSVNFNNTDTATITGLSLETSKTHTIELINLTDKGGNVTVSTSTAFNVNVDSAAPTATLTAQGDKGILVTFSKPMDVASVAAAFTANNGVKNETLDAVNTSAVVSAVADTNDTQFLIPVTSTLYADKTSRTLTVVFPNTIQDKLGNNIAAGSQAVTLTKDSTKPVATGYKVIKNANGEVTDIEVSFSEGLAADANPAEPTIVNDNGVNVTASLLGGLTADAIVAGDKKVTYSANTAAKVSGKYAFSFPVNLVTDQSEVGNKSAVFNYTIDFGAGATSFDLPSNPTSAANVITVEFGKAVKGGAVANSATDLANYTLSGKPLPEGTTILLDAAQDTATITLPAESIAKSDTNAVFTVANVKSLSNETVTNYSGTLAVVDNAKPLLKSASFTSDNKLVTVFSEDLAAAPTSTEFIIKLNGKAVTTTPTFVAGTGSDAGKYVVDLDSLVKNDATQTYIDIDGNNTYAAATDIFVKTEATKSAFSITSSPVVTSASITVVDAPATTKDTSALNNVLTGKTVITVK
ncbi:hypothetical protein V7068_15415 [Bacillus sp. JJ634]